MAKKKSFVVRLDPEMLDAVQKWAADEFRSTNGQLEWIIHKALKEARRDYKKKTKGSTGSGDKTPEPPSDPKT